MTIAALAPFRSAPVAPPVDEDFAGLYREYRPQLLRYVTHHFGFRDADEITQETLTRALRALDRNRSEAETWAWLVRVARNVAHDLARARRICEATDDDAVLANDVADDAILPEPAALLDERRRLVRRALTMLPPSQRRILVLYEVDELNCPAIARLVGSTEDAVRKALQRARRRFATEVRALGGGSAAGSFGFWLRGLRRRGVKLMPAASASTAICALLGTVALTVVAHPVPQRLLSPALTSPVASSVRELDHGSAGTAVGRNAAAHAPHAAGNGSSATAPSGSDGDNATKVHLVVPTTPLSPGQRTTLVAPTVYTPYGTVHWRYDVEVEDRPGVVCSLEQVECEYEGR